MTTTVDVRSCKSCKGNWLDHAQVKRLVDDELVLASDAREAIACPICHQSMHTKKLYGVAVDRCTQHGMWFDRDERDQICKLAQTGGVKTSGSYGVLDAVAGLLEAVGQLLSAL